MVEQAEIHRKAASGDVEERIAAVGQLGCDFADLPDKSEAWDDLHRLTGDVDLVVRLHAADALSTAFQHVPDKDVAWDDLHRMTRDDVGIFVWGHPADALGTAFQHVPDKSEAWEDLHRLTWEEDDNVRWSAVEVLGSVFQHIPDKEQAQKDLHQRIGDKYSGVRRGATYSLGTVFPYVPDKEQAQKDLHQRTRDDDDDEVRWLAARALGSVFQHVPDKKEAWQDLIWLTEAEDKYVRLGAADALGSAFQHALDKEEAWNDLHRLTRYEDEYVRASANHSLGRASIFKATEVEGSDDFKSELKNAIQFFERSLKETDFNPSKFCLPFYRLFYMIASEKTGAEDEVQRCLDEAEGVLEGSKNKETLLKAAKNLVNASIEIQNAGEATIRDFSHHLNDYMQYFDCAIKLTGAAERGAPGAAQVLQRTMSMVDERHKHIQRECDETFKRVYGTSPPVPTQTVPISETEQKIVRIAVAQFCFELTESFPFVLKNKDEVKTKVFSALEIAKQNGADIVCLPELCLCEDWIIEIKKKYTNMIIIGGSFYKANKNICPVILESDVEIPYQPKITPSDSEIGGATRLRMIPGDRIHIYETRFGRFVVLICRDFYNLEDQFRKTKIDMIFCPSYNSADERFQNAAHVHVEKVPSYILIANTGKYGGTSIFGQLHKKHLDSLVDDGCKDAKEVEAKKLACKLCEVKKGQEEVIIADFNLVYKSIQTPTPADPEEEIRSVRYPKKIPIHPDRSRFKVGKE